MNATADPQLVTSVCAECGADVQFAFGQAQARCDYCGGGQAVSDGLMIRLDCPRCGGNFYYIDGSMCGSCPYCEASLLALSRRRILRLVIQARAPAPDPAARLHLLPFWRLTGLSLGWDVGARRTLDVDSKGATTDDGMAVAAVSIKDSGPRKEFRGRVLDVSLADDATSALGIASLRLRAAVFPAELLTAAHEEQATLVPSRLDADAAREMLISRALCWGSAIDQLQLDCQRIDLVAPTLMLLYYPFWLRGGEGRAAWDGVTGAAESLSTSSAPLAGEATATTAAFDQLKVIELRCGHCGGALPRGNHAIVLPCQQCGRFWVDEGGAELTPFEGQWARPQIADTKILWLPFWRIRTRVRWGGREATTAADLRSVLSVMSPRMQVPVEPPDAKLVYYAPAYGALRTPRLDFAARDMTRLQPKLEAGPTGKGEAFHCFYAPEDARRLAYVVWLQLLAGAAAKLVRSLRVAAEDVDLWYVPFADLGRELQNLVTGLRYDRTAFAGVRH